MEYDAHDCSFLSVGDLGDAAYARVFYLTHPTRSLFHLVIKINMINGKSLYILPLIHRKGESVYS
ncbi:hypothetical protein QE368_000889 [Asaia bogorensis NBRC 16594]|nr:hypothetical protein [Asaia bogorensis NBRC 16594]